MSPRVFLVTGCSTGFGKEYVQEIIDQGDYVVATARKPEQLKFEKTTNDNYLAVKLDVTKQEDIDSAFAKALEKFKRVDVVVNNAGYGLAGAFEELSDADGRQQFEVNFFGLTQVTKKALEVLRDQKPSGGLIQMVTSIGGQRGVPLFTYYCASKWAVEGFTAALRQELKEEWKIKLQCAEPGGFRTDWAGRSMKFPEKKHPAYDHLPAEKMMKERNGKQAGDPAKGAKAMYKLATLDSPPDSAVIGSDAATAIQGKIKMYSELYGRKELQDIANSCDVDGYERPS